MERRDPIGEGSLDEEEEGEEEEVVEDEDEKEDESAGEDDEEGDEDEEATNALRKALEEAVGSMGMKAGNESSDEESDEESMDDEQMMKIDEKLAAVFRSRVEERKKGKSTSFHTNTTMPLNLLSYFFFL